MSQTFQERIIFIMERMYRCNAEIVIEIDEEACYIFIGSTGERVPITFEEIDCLEQNEIIELDGGASGDIQETPTTRCYRLTDMADQRITDILQNKKTLSLNA